MRGVSATTRDLVTFQDLADLYGITKRSVTRWFEEHDDAPAPIDKTPAGSLFNRAEIETWLRRSGRVDIATGKLVRRREQ